MNRIGDRGSPCLRPRPLWKNPKASPSTSREKEAVEKYAERIQIIVSVKPIEAKVTLMAFQSIVSKALVMSKIIHAPCVVPFW